MLWLTLHFAIIYRKSLYFNLCAHTCINDKSNSRAILSQKIQIIVAITFHINEHVVKVFFILAQTQPNFMWFGY